MIFQMMSLLHSIRVIPLGFEPKTHSLEEYTRKKYQSVVYQMFTKDVKVPFYSFY